MLDAEIVTNKRSHQARDFYRDILTTALEHDEVVTAVRFPVSTGRFAYTKFRRRLYDWALAGVAVQESGSSWRVGYVNLARTPRRGTAVEAALAAGASAVDAAGQSGSDIDPTSDVRATAEYKRHVTEVLTARTLQAAAAVSS
jgi:carbon-monoxide dehydrogenase medium subunit